jgi:hypothetical protein
MDSNTLLPIPVEDIDSRDLPDFTGLSEMESRSFCGLGCDDVEDPERDLANACLKESIRLNPPRHIVISKSLVT